MPVARYESTEVDESPLAQPLTFEFSKRTAKNRLMKAAMEERLATWDDNILEKRGLPTKELIDLYRRYVERPLEIPENGVLINHVWVLDGANNQMVGVSLLPATSLLTTRMWLVQVAL
jgi:hypothetical protein